MPSHPQSPADSVSALTRAIVGVVASHTGRGPTKISVTLGQDVVCVVMSGNHTKGELALLADGNHALVTELRRAYYQAMRDALFGAAEFVIGREVRGVLADHDPLLDVSILNFVLSSVVTPSAGSDDRQRKAASGSV